MYTCSSLLLWQFIDCQMFRIVFILHILYTVYYIQKSYQQLQAINAKNMPKSVFGFYYEIQPTE